MTLIVLDTTFTPIDFIEDFSSLIWTEKYSACGDFELCVAPSSNLINLFAIDNYLASSDSNEIMIIESQELKTDSEAAHKLIVRGRSLSSILDRRLIFQRQIYDAVGIQSAIQDILNKNGIASPGQPQRNISGLYFVTSSDPNVLAPQITAEFYGEGVYDTIKFICDRSSLGFTILHTDSNKFAFSLYSGTDRSYDQNTNPFVVFSHSFDNLLSSDFLYTKRFKKTIALIAGDAYNVSVRPIWDFDPWENDPDNPNYPTIRTDLERRELFVDAPDLSMIDPNTGQPFTQQQYIPIMYERARRALSEAIEYNYFNGGIDTTKQFKYRVDFFLGDIVQIVDSFGHEAKSRIIEMTRSVDSSGVKEYPTLENV